MPFIWTLLPAPDGGYFLGTGNDGKVLRVDKAGTSSVFFDSGEMEVHALASAPNGGLYVGTSPDGRIYKVDARARAAPFFDPEDKYIWALAVDPKGVVYAATGDKGTVYRITPDGKGDRFFATQGDTRGCRSRSTPSGQLLVGTGSPGRVFRVDTGGKGFLLLDTSYQEVRALTFDPKGVLYVAAQSARARRRRSGEPPPAGHASPAGRAERVDRDHVVRDHRRSRDAAAESDASGEPGDRRGPTGAIYRVLPDGLWDQLWESRDDAPYDVAFDADGSLLVATGGKGKIFRLAGDPDASDAADARLGAAGHHAASHRRPHVRS